MCKILPSTRSHARILKIDTSKAEQLPGIRGIVTGEDFPDAHFAVSPGWLRDRRIMARDKVRFLGEPIAAVAADDEKPYGAPHHEGFVTSKLSVPPLPGCLIRARWFVGFTFYLDDGGTMPLRRMYVTRLP